MNVLAGKKIVVGVTGSIAAFKVAGWVSDLSKEEAQVFVTMTEAATKFITPLTFAALSGNSVHSSMFDEATEDCMAHITLGRDADIVLIAPATANCIAKLAHGIADDLLTTLVLATSAKILICPAMNPRMYKHKKTQENLQILRESGHEIVEPACGIMACKEEGEGRLPEWSDVKEKIIETLSVKDLRGSQVLITAGPTREPIDPARFISNRSSGKMGYALAKAAARRGAHVLLISGPCNLPVPLGVSLLSVQTAQEMYDAVLAHAKDKDIIIKAAAVADFRPSQTHTEKVKKKNIAPELLLSPNPDILLKLGETKKENQMLIGFAAESENHLSEGLKKLKKKNLDMIAVNNINSVDTGFEADTNQLLLISQDGTETLPFTSKIESANLLLDRVVQYINQKL